MKLYKIASLAGAIAMTGMSVASVAAAPPLTLQPISIGASVLQFLLAIATIPLVKIFPPSVLRRPLSPPSTPTCRMSR